MPYSMKSGIGPIEKYETGMKTKVKYYLALDVDDDNVAAISSDKQKVISFIKLKHYRPMRLRKVVLEDKENIIDFEHKHRGLMLTEVVLSTNTTKEGYVIIYLPEIESKKLDYLLEFIEIGMENAMIFFSNRDVGLKKKYKKAIEYLLKIYNKYPEYPIEEGYSGLVSNIDALKVYVYTQLEDTSRDNLGLML